MAIQLDFTNMLASAIGERFGISDNDLEGLKGRAQQIHQDLTSRRQAGQLPFYDLPYDTEGVAKIKALALELRGRFDDIVVLGIGGSALGTTALFHALRPLTHNQMSQEQRGGLPRLFVLDNVDPSGIAETLDLLRPERTLFLVISKSGTTVETMCQFMIARGWVSEAAGEQWRQHFVLITDPESGVLRALANAEGIMTLPIPPGVGGRFSVFTAVGLLPLALVGVDIDALLSGAAQMDKRVSQAGLMENPAYLNAALQYLAYQKGLTISVMMPYSDHLRDLADWFRQLWAESLGKKKNLAGDTVHVGPTPVKALGTTDQHSQVQLYVEGPFDKVVTFVGVDNYGRDLTMPEFPENVASAYLEGQTLSHLIRSEQKATAFALLKNNRSNCTISLSEINAESIGALVYMFEVQTLFAGGLWEVDPLDQPGVEDGKIFTYALMGREGFSQVKDEFKIMKSTFILSAP